MMKIITHNKQKIYNKIKFKMFKLKTKNLI